MEFETFECFMMEFDCFINIHYLVITTEYSLRSMYILVRSYNTLTETIILYLFSSQLLKPLFTTYRRVDPFLCGEIGN